MKPARAVVSAAFTVVLRTGQSQLVMEPDFLTWICQFKKGRSFYHLEEDVLASRKGRL